MSEMFITHSAAETRALGQTLAGRMQPGMLLCLSGDLGSGKTTLAQGLLAGFGTMPPYTSPTFVLMKQYDVPVPTAQGIRRVYHADAYRVTDKDFEHLGFAEWCADPEGIVILEWPQRVQNILPHNAINIALVAKNENEREVTVEW